jgi:hypothetical protein
VRAADERQVVLSNAMQGVEPPVHRRRGGGSLMCEGPRQIKQEHGDRGAENTAAVCTPQFRERNAAAGVTTRTA